MIRAVVVMRIVRAVCRRGLVGIRRRLRRVSMSIILVGGSRDIIVIWGLSMGNELPVRGRGGVSLVGELGY